MEKLPDFKGNVKVVATGRELRTFTGHKDKVVSIAFSPDGDLAQARVYLEMDELAPEAAACVTVNGRYAGGFIDKPFRLEVARFLKAGPNKVKIEPFAPKAAKLLVYPAK